MIKDAEEQVRVIRERLKTAQSRQKSYYDRRHQDVQYEIGEKAYLRVTPLKRWKTIRNQGQVSTSLCWSISHPR